MIDVDGPFANKTNDLISVSVGLRKVSAFISLSPLPPVAMHAFFLFTNLLLPTISNPKSNYPTNLNRKKKKKSKRKKRKKPKRMMILVLPFPLILALPFPLILLLKVKSRNLWMT